MYLYTGEHVSIYGVKVVGLYFVVKCQYVSHGCPTF